jgi:hypothetical protein
MPPKKNVTSGANSGSYKLPDFVSCELSDKERQIVKENIMPANAILTNLHELAFAGIKVSLSYNKQNDCFQAFATGGQNSGPEFSGLCLAGRGPAVDSALTVLFFKHFEILKEDWRSAGKTTQGDKWG